MSNTEHWVVVKHDRKFITFTVYRELRGTKEQMDWIKILCRNNARPRAKFTLWMMLNGKLPTKERLMKFRLINSSICCFCDNYESVDHLFFAYARFNNIWRGILLPMGIRRNPENWHEEKTWLIRETKKRGGKKKILRVAIEETVYELWRSRNDKFFFPKGYKSLLDR
ncbi:uncharacterized protein LOC127131506 [Lathyrus oleraceus]|uniref:uncharacterized protein LOC127131506 n=1 Tax=Pisum sativum TaxID=3888 RepID=UPI0021CF089F|nr:uncharacterized protein LOC127131506 [Pisum sativum]